MDDAWNIFAFIFWFLDASSTNSRSSKDGKGSTNHQRLSAGAADKDMDNLRRWFTDKLALGLGNDVDEKPQVIL